MNSDDTSKLLNLSSAHLFNEILIIFVLIFAFTSSSFSIPSKAQLKFQNLTVQDGLSHNSIRHIMQDHFGYLWISTFEGLCRYDGYDFKIYKPDPKDSLSLSHNIIQIICEDTRHNLWVGTAKGLNRYVRGNESFIAYLHDPENQQSISHNNVSAICQDSLGNVWIGTLGGGLNLYNENSNSFRKYVHDKNNKHSLSHNNIRVLTCDSKNRLWVGTDDGGLNMFVPQKEQFIRYQFDPANENSLSHNVIMDIVEDKSGSLWIGTWDGGLNKFHPETGNFTHFKMSKRENSISGNIITSLCIDNNNVLWAGTWTGGVNRLDLDKYVDATEESAVFETYSYDKNDDFSISTNIVWSLFEDRSGLMWIGTEAGGLCKVVPNSEQFYHIKSKINEPNSLISNNISVLFEDSFSRIWVGTKNHGITVFDYTNNSFNHLATKDGDQHSIASNHILSISENPAGIYWIGTDGHGLDKYNEKTGQFTHYCSDPFDDTSLSNNYIHSLYTDRDGDLWIGSWGGGLNKYIPRIDGFQSFDVDSLNPARNIVSHISQNSDGYLWLAAYGTGLVKFDPINYTKEYFIPDRSNVHTVNSDVIHDIYEDEDGNLWIATTGGGLNFYNVENKTFEYITQEDGLSSDVIFGILEDSHNNIWLTSIMGITKFDPKNRVFKNFTQNDGLQNDIFNTNSAIKLDTGEMAVGGINGLTIFHPDSIKKNENPPPVVITDFRIFNVSEPLHHFQRDSKIDMIELSYKLNVFSFEFAALDFTNPFANKYAYKMEGFDQDWIYTDASRRFATYTNLRGGDYVFRVKGSNSYGVWNNVGTSLDVVILPPFWRTDLALALYISIVIITLIIMRKIIQARERFKTNIEMERIEARQTHELDQLKLRFFTGISHEFRTPLMLIIGPMERMLHTRGKISNRKFQLYSNLVLRNAKRLLRLVNQLMDARKLDTGNMHLNLQSKDIIHSIRAICSAFEYQAEQRLIDFQLKTDLSNLEMNFDQDKIEKILYNLLSNSFKFVADSGVITVSVYAISNDVMKKESEQVKKCLQIIVEDNGIGISNEQQEHIFDYFYQVDGERVGEQEGTGIGLYISKEYAKMHGGHIEVESEVGKGSRFILYLPIERQLVKGNQPAIDEIYTDNTYHIEEYKLDENEEEPQIIEMSERQMVLIIEDNPELRLYLRYELNQNYEIIEAENGSSGLSAAIKYIPDLIICDIMMPVIDGIEFCSRCKSDEKTSHIPIILLTARTSEEIQIKGLQSGADEYITKPFNIELLKTRIENLLENRSKLKQIYSNEIFLKSRNMSVSSVDEKFIEKIKSILEDKLDDPLLHVDYLSSLAGLSRTQFYRKCQGLLGQTPNEFINNFRLTKAAQFLKAGYSISEVAFKVGFRDPSYFSKSFRKRYNMSPSQYIEMQ